MQKEQRIRTLLLTALFAILISIGITQPEQVDAETEILWGPKYCGPDAMVYVDTDMNMYIVGTGEMNNSTWNVMSDGIKQNWNEYQSPAIRNIIISEGITRIGESNFAGIKNVEKVSIPSTMVSIGKYAFNGCGIQELELPEGVKYIENYAFAGHSLDEVVIPASVVSMDRFSFTSSDPKKVTRYSVSEKNSSFIIEDDLLMNKKKTVVFRCMKNGGKVVVPKTVKRIFSYAFYNCHLDEVILPEGLKEIRYAALRGNDFSSVLIPESVEVLGQEAFADCDKLKTIVIPEYVKILSANVLRECDSLEEVAILAPVEKIGWMFWGSEALRTIYLPDTVSWMDPDTFRVVGEDLNGDGNNDKYLIPDDLVIYAEKGSYAEEYASQYGIRFEAVTNESKMRIAPTRAVKNADPSKNQDWVWGPKQCGQYAEAYVNSEGDLYIFGKSSIDMGYTLLEDYDEYFPENRPIFDANYDGPKIKNIYVGEGINSIANGSFLGLTDIDTISLPSTLSSIYSDAFRGCGVQKLELPDSLTYIGSYAFAGNRLKEVKLPARVDRIGNGAFFTEEQGKHILFSLDSDNPYVSLIDGLLTDKSQKVLKSCLYYGGSCIIPDSVTVILYDAFKNCQLEKVVLPKGLEEIQQAAFSGNSFQEIDIPEKVELIGEKAFENCNALEKVVIHGNISYIGYSTFEGCGALRQITIPDSVRNIMLRAFWGCESLSFLRLPADLEYIDGSAFHNSGLQCVYIPEKIKSLNWDTFCTVRENPLDPLYENEIWDYPEGFTIYGESGSFAETFANRNDIPFFEAKKLSKSSGLTFSLSKNSYNYANKAWRPVVTIKDGAYTLVQGVDYTVSYKDNKAVGTARVTVTGIGKYFGSKYFSYKILPRPTTISKLAADKKGFTATIRKQATQTTGYQLRYSTSEDMSGAKTVTIADNTICRKQITKLKAKQKYYVQVRTYTLKDGKKYYSAWSNAKSIVTK